MSDDRTDHESQEREATIAAILEGMADVKAGRVRPAREAIEDLMRKHGLMKPGLTDHDPGT